MLQPAVRHRGPSRALDAYVCERSKGRAQDDTGGGARCLWPEQLRGREERRNTVLLPFFLSSVDASRPLTNEGWRMK